MNDLLKTGGFLLLICGIAAIALAFTEQVTGPRIRAQAEEALREAQRSVLPAAARFATAMAPASAALGTVATHAIAIGVASDGKTVGFVVQAAPKGYGGPIVLVVGLDPELVVQKVIIQKNPETPGLGTKLSEKFMDRFLERCRELRDKANLKVRQDGGDIDGITAATVSSRAFLAGIRDSIELVRRERATLLESLGTAAPDGAAAIGGGGASPVSIPAPAPIADAVSTSSPTPIPAPTVAPDTIPAPDLATGHGGDDGATTVVAPAPATGPVVAPPADGPAAPAASNSAVTGGEQ